MARYAIPRACRESWSEWIRLSSGREPIIDPLTGVIDDQGECVNICVDDFIKPLRAIKERVADLLNAYCVNRLPACYVQNLMALYDPVWAKS